MAHPTILEEIRNHNVTKYDAHEGPVHSVGNLKLTWKAEGENTGYQFSVFEIHVAPGNGLPLHLHPYPEFFYVLEGELDFAHWDSAGDEVWLKCGSGVSVMAPPNAPHRFFNKGEQPARLLSVSTFHHEMMLKDSFAATGWKTQFTAEEFGLLFKSQEKHQSYAVTK